VLLQYRKYKNIEIEIYSVVSGQISYTISLI